MADEPGRKQVALEEYKEVLAQLRALTDIRFKLIAFLPIGTVAAVLVPKENHTVAEPAVALFAFVATLCIAAYNKRNDQHYDELVSRAGELERDELGMDHGSFSHRPRAWLRYGPLPVEHRWPIGLLYAAAAALWASIFAAVVHPSTVPPGIQPQYIAPALVIGCWLLLKQLESRRKKRLRAEVRSLVTQLLSSSPSPVDAQQGLVTAIVMEKGLFGVDPETAQRRVSYHWVPFDRKRDMRSASGLLSQVLDLPARWIEDISGGRRWS